MGPGLNTIPAAKTVGINGKVYALDINPSVIAIVDKKLKNSNLDNVETIITDCEIPLEAQLVDIVYLHNTLPLIKRKKDVLREIQRVLKLNGKLSYMSRKGSRVMGKDSMNDNEVREFLENDLHFLLVLERKGHFIFERNH